MRLLGGPSLRFCFLQGWGRLSLAERHRESGGKPPQSKEGAAVLRPYNRNGDVKSPLQRRAELAGGEVFHGAKACVEFGGRQAILTRPSSDEVRGTNVDKLPYTSSPNFSWARLRIHSSASARERNTRVSHPLCSERTWYRS